LTILVTGHAIVSADGMIADAHHRTPAALRNEADWRRFQRALDAARLVVLGRLGHELHPNPGRPRLVVTSRVEALAPDAADPNATLWNPAGVEFAAVLAELGIDSGTVAVTGGQHVFDLFLPLFDRFDLAEAGVVLIPGGVPCFSDGPPGTMLADAGLRPGRPTDLGDAVTLTVWRR
jgi:dihydrofolate reductase